MSHTSSNISTATATGVNADTAADAKPRKPGRILAIDVMRGITVAGMILVNNSGARAPTRRSNIRRGTV